jgi:hypothetical protein
MYQILQYPVKISIFIYILISLVVLYNRPELIFLDDGISKGFGCAHDCEFFNFPVILYSSAIVITFIFEYISIKLE